MSLSRRCCLLVLAALAWRRPQAAPSAPPLMLARPYRGKLSLADYLVSEKFDGVRGWWDGRQLLTRQGHPVPAPAWFTAGWPAVPLDGELWAGRGRFATAASAIARNRPDDSLWRQMRYLVFDLPAHPGRFDERLRALTRAVEALERPWVDTVVQTRVADQAALQSLLDTTVRNGGEGLVLRQADAPYRSDRSDALLKLKPHDDADARVVGQEPGRGKYAGLMGALWVEMSGGLRFRLGSGFSDDDRREPPRAGAIVTYRYRGLNPSGRPRFASYLRQRPD